MWMQYKELTTMDYHGRYKLGWMVKGEGKRENITDSIPSVNKK